MVKKGKRVIIVGPAYPYRGGIADTNEALCRAFNRIGSDCSIVTFTMQYPSLLFPGKSQFSTDPPPFGIVITRMLHSLNPVSWWNTAHKIKKLNPDLVLIRYWIPFLAPALGSVARFLKSTVHVIGICDNVIPHEKRIGDKQFTSYFAGQCHAFVTLSKTVKEELGKFTDQKILYIPHPINDHLGNRIEKVEARKQLNLDPQGKYLLFFGLVRKYKGLDLIIKALANDSLKNLNVQLLVVGEFYDDPKMYEDFIEGYGLQDRIHITNEFIPTEDIKKYFSAADIITQTYHTASQSGVTQIAYNFDRPMLVTNVGGLSEMIPHMKVGYVVEKDPGAIANAVLDFYENEREEVFVNHIKVEKLKFSWDNFAEDVQALSDEL